MESLLLAPKHRTDGMPLHILRGLVNEIYPIDSITLVIDDETYNYQYRFLPKDCIGSNPFGVSYMKNISYFIERNYGGHIIISSDTTMEHVIYKPIAYYSNRVFLNALELLPDELIHIIIGYLKESIGNSRISFNDADCLYNRPLYLKDQIEYIVRSIDRPSLYKYYKADLRSAFFNYHVYNIELIEQLIAENPKESLNILNMSIYVMRKGIYNGWVNELEFMEFIRLQLRKMGANGLPIYHQELITSLIDLNEFSLLRTLNIHYYDTILKYLSEQIVKEGTSILANLNTIERLLPQCPIRKYFMSNLTGYDGIHKVFSQVYCEEWDPEGNKFIEGFELIATRSDSTYTISQMIESVRGNGDYLKTIRMNNIYLGLSDPYREQLLEKLRRGGYMCDFKGSDVFTREMYNQMMRLPVITTDSYVLANHLACYQPNGQQLKILLRDVKVINAKDPYGKIHPELLNEEIAKKQIHTDNDPVFTVYEWEGIWLTLACDSRKGTNESTLNWFIEFSESKGVKLCVIEMTDIYHKDFLKKRGLLKEDEEYEFYYGY